MKLYLNLLLMGVLMASCSSLRFVQQELTIDKVDQRQLASEQLSQQKSNINFIDSDEEEPLPTARDENKIVRFSEMEEEKKTQHYNCIKGKYFKFYVENCPKDEELKAFCHETLNLPFTTKHRCKKLFPKDE